MSNTGNLRTVDVLARIALVTWYVAFVAWWAVRALTGSLFGILLFSATAYLIAPAVLDVHPYDARELTLWADALTPDAKIAVATSLLTIVGFLVAFQSATSTWRAELKTQVRLQASGEIYATYDAVNKKVGAVRAYAEALIDVCQAAELAHNSLAQKCYWAHHLGQSYPSTNLELHGLNVDAQKFYGKFSQQLFNVWNGIDDIRKANLAIERVLDRSSLSPPLTFPANVNFVTEFVGQIDCDAVRALRDACDEATEYIAGVTGALRGKLTAGVERPTLTMLIQSLRRPDVILGGFRILLRRPKQSK